MTKETTMQQAWDAYDKAIQQAGDAYEKAKQQAERR